jgi:hypothetical protein
MKQEKSLEFTGIRKDGGSSFEVSVGEMKKSKFITLPLSYDFEFSPTNEKGEVIPISSVIMRGTTSIIKTTGEASQWKLKIMKGNEADSDLGDTDPTGKPATIDPDENGDGFDWLRDTTNELDEKIKQSVGNAFQSAQRTIIFQSAAQ